MLKNDCRALRSYASRTLLAHKMCNEIRRYFCDRGSVILIMHEQVGIGKKLGIFYQKIDLYLLPF